jgi:hypothetical protein
MKVCVSNRLAGSGANVDAYVVARRHFLRFDVTTHCRHQRPHRSLFRVGEGEIIRLVSSWDNEAVAHAQRESVEEGDGEIVRYNEVSDRQAVTKDAFQM